MISIDEQSGGITTSFGDLLELYVDFDKQLDPETVLTFSIKQGTKVLLTAQLQRVEDPNRSIYRIFVPSLEMKKLLPGIYAYDIYCKLGENYKTLNYSQRLEVVEVSHDVQ